MEIELKKICFKYKNKSQILNNLDLKINSNLITGIIGNTGSGKTTLLEMLDLLILPTKGKIKIGNDIVNSKTKKNDLNDIRKNIGYLFQNQLDQLFELNVKKQLNVSNDNFLTISEMLNMLGLNDEYLNRNIEELSDGELRKLGLVSILIKNPELILLDNPTIGLDSKSKKNLIKLLRNLKVKYNKTILIASQDIEFIHAVCDDVVIINNGEIKISGNKYNVFKNDKILEENGIIKPNLISFSDEVYNKKGIKIGYRDDIKDLIKDIYRYAK